MTLRKWLRSYYYDAIAKLCKFTIPPNKKVLHIGCRDGELLAQLRASHGVGIDVNHEAIRAAQSKHKGLIFHCVSPEDFVPNEKFDYIVLSAIGTAKDLYKVFEVIRTACHKNTRIIIHYHNYIWEPILSLAGKLRLKEPQPIQNWLTLNDISNFLYVSGMDVVRRSKELLLPVKVPLIATFLNRYVARLPLFGSLCLVQYIVARPLIHEVRDLSVSVIVPTRNEKGNIERAARSVPKMGKHTEIIFVEGNSTDGTKEEIERVIDKYKNRDIKLFVQKDSGKWGAVQLGFDNASGDILMICDGDLTTPPEDLPKFFEVIASGKGEFVNASRFVYQMEGYSMPFANKIVNKFFSIVFKWIMGQRLTDTLCGTKVLRKQDYLEMKKQKYFLKNDRFGDFSLIFGATRMNLKIIEIPVAYKARTYGNTKISGFNSGWVLFKVMLKGMKSLKFFSI